MSNTTYAIDELNDHFPVVFQQHVAWGDMDAFGHVNNAVYYRYAENTRIHYINKLDVMNDDIYIVVFKNSCTYIRPVSYPDTLHIATKITQVRSSGFEMQYEFYSEAQQVKVAVATAVIVSVDAKTHQKCALPEAAKQTIMAMENAAGNSVESL